MVIRSIDPSIFILNNEFGITFYINGEMYYKKLTFVTGSIAEEYTQSIQVLGMEGILHS